VSLVLLVLVFRFFVLILDAVGLLCQYHSQVIGGNELST